MIRFDKPCPQCGGTGVDKPEGCRCIVFRDTGGFRIADLGCSVHGASSGFINPDGPWDPCPACHSGMVPDDGTVEAAAKAWIAAVPHLPRWDFQPVQLQEAAKEYARAALVAAARYQWERGRGDEMRLP